MLSLSLSLSLSLTHTPTPSPLNWLFPYRILPPPPPSPLSPLSQVTGAFCLGVFDNGNAGTLLGGLTFRDTLVVYDVGESRVGFRTGVACGALAALSSTPAPATPPPRR
jgi:hypothetical protein